MTQRVGADALAEDVFGLNVRGLKTMRDAVLRPGVVFAAARSRDWSQRYTPSVRVVFWLLTATSFLRFLWASDDSAMFLNFEANLSAVEDPARRRELARSVLAAYAALVPFLFLAFEGLLAAVLRVWGVATSYAERYRLLLVALIPSTLFLTLMTLTLPFLPLAAVVPVGYAVAASAVILDASTGARGGVAGRGVGRFWRAALLGVAAQAASLLADGVALTVAVLIASRTV